MKGLLIYDVADVNKNRSYIKWFLEEAQKRKIGLELIYSRDFFMKGLSSDQVKADFAINRSRSFELAANLELNGIRVMNNSEITFLGNNKIAAYKYAKSVDVAFSPLLASWEREQELISKLTEGHGGEGVEVLQSSFPDFSPASLQQELQKDLLGDVRFYILNNKIIHSVLRKPKCGSYISNFSKGGEIQIYRPSDTEEQLIYKFIGRLNIDYAGLDFLLLNDGRLLFNEIEDVVGSRMLSALGINNTIELFFLSPIFSNRLVRNNEVKN